MNEKHLLKVLQRSKGVIELDHCDVGRMEIFTSFEDVFSLDNIALIAYGHTSQKRRFIDKNKIETWCNANDILFNFDEVNRTLLLKIE